VERLLSGKGLMPIDDRHGEGFRTPARAGRASRAGPASDSRPCTNPRGTSAALWGFEESGAGAEVARPRQPTAIARQRCGWMGFKSVDRAMPCREVVRLWRYRRGRTAFGGSGGATARSSKQQGFDVRLRLAVPGGLPGDWGCQAAIATCEHRSLAGWNRCPKPEPSVPL